MKKTSNDDLYLMHHIRGQRLTDAMKENQIKPAELLRRAKAQSESYFNMSPQALSKIMHGIRPLHYHDAVIFADILGVDTDYLMGGKSPHMKFTLKHEKEAEKYKIILNLIGSNIVSYISDEDDAGNFILEAYGVSYNHRPYDLDEATAILEQVASPTGGNEVKGAIVGSHFDIMDVSPEDMENFYQDVHRFIKKRFDILKELCAEEK